MLCKRTFADRRRGSHQNRCIRANKFRFAFSLSASTRAGLASPAIPDKVNEPVAVAAQSADGGFSPLRPPVMAIDVASWLQQLGGDNCCQHYAKPDAAIGVHFSANGGRPVSADTGRSPDRERTAQVDP